MTAPPLLCLHGFTGVPASFDDLIAALPASRAVHAPRLLGHGSDSRSEEFDDEVDRIAAALQDSAPVHLLGYSMGARLGLGMIIRHPAKVARATLIGVHPGLATAEDRAARIHSDAHWIHLLETEGIESFVAAWEALPMWASQARVPAPRLAAQRAARLGHDAGGLATALRVLGLGRMPERGPRLAEIRTPIQLVIGEEDAKFFGIALRLADRLPRARLAVVPGSGHNPILERPTAVAELVLAHDRRSE